MQINDDFSIIRITYFCFVFFLRDLFEKYAKNCNLNSSYVRLDNYVRI